MRPLPPELLQNILRETNDVEVLLPLLRSDNVSDVFKECFEVVTTHDGDLKFWSKRFKRTRLHTAQPIKGKQYLIEFPLDIVNDSFDEIGPEFDNLLRLNGFVYMYCQEDFHWVKEDLMELFKSERLLVVGTDGSLTKLRFLFGEVNLDNLRYIPLDILKMNHVFLKGELNQAIRELDINSVALCGNIIEFINPAVFKSLEALKISRGRAMKFKDIEFPRLESCELIGVSQMENLKFPRLNYLYIFLADYDGVFLKDIEAPALETFSLSTKRDFEVKNVVFNYGLKWLSLYNRSDKNIDIKGLEDWCVTTDTLRLVEAATTLSSKSFIQRSQNVIIKPSQREVQFLNSLKEEYTGIKQLAFTCREDMKCSVIRAPNLEGLWIKTAKNADLPLLSQSYTSITKLELFMDDLPKNFYGIKKLQKLKSLSLTSCFFDVKEMKLDSRNWLLPNLESLVIEFPLRNNLDDLTIDMSTPKLKSVSVTADWPDRRQRTSLKSLTLTNLPILKDVVADCFSELIIADNMGSTIESIDSMGLSRIQAKNLSNVKQISYKIPEGSPHPFEDVENISEIVEKTIAYITMDKYESIMSQLRNARHSSEPNW